MPCNPAIPLLFMQGKQKTLIWKNKCMSIFATVLSTTAKVWKQPKSPSMYKWIKKMRCVYTHTHTYIVILLRHKKNDILPFSTSWMDLEGIMLSEICQRRTNNILIHLSGEHFVMYMIVEPLCCTLHTNLILYVKYTSAKK